MRKQEHHNRSTVILGVPFSGLTNDETLDCLDQMIAARSRHIIVTANLDCTVRAHKDPMMKRVMYSASLVTPDGMPIVWAGRTMKPSLKERVAGSDFVPLLLERAAEKGHSVFFLGGREEITRRAVALCEAKYPGLKIAGSYSPLFGTVWEMDNIAMVSRINEASPDILIVAFGNPKQEYLMAMHHDKLNVPVKIGVGGTIDFLSGIIPRAPEWMKNLGVEWLFRLSLEPRRLAKRYAIDIVQGLIPLIVQTSANGLMRLTRAILPTGSSGVLNPSRISVTSGNENVHVAVFERCTGDNIEQLASHLEQHVGSETDGVILDLRGGRIIDSEILSEIVAIDQALRNEGKHCILITGFPAKAMLRLARLNDLLMIVRDKEAALNLLREMGKRLLSVSHAEVGGGKHLLSLRGELTKETSFVLDRVRVHLADIRPAIFDFTGIRFFDTGGLQSFVEGWHAARGTGAPIHCVPGSSKHESLFGTPGLRQHFITYPTVDDALAAFNGNGPTGMAAERTIPQAGMNRSGGK